MIVARFEGGPADGYELGLAGRQPGYMLLMRPPGGVAPDMEWIVVGADFDDGWPGQLRYDREAFGLTPNERDELELHSVIYRYAEEGT